MASLNEAQRVVVKIGSALLVDRQTGLRADWLASIAQDIAALKARGADVVLVSSGSIALGRGILKLPYAELPLEQSQAAAAVGQIGLARAWEEALAPHGLTTAQVLLTLEDTSDRRRYLNARATLETLLGFGAVPIVNENDTVATDEIRYGDNDRLAAQIAVTIGADTLVLLSDVDGLYTANPNTDPDAQHFDIVDKITPEIEAMAGEGVSGLSKGGMITKLMAAKTATASGCAMAICHGADLHPLDRLAKGARATWFTPDINPHAARKRWIAAMKPQGVLTIDAGAARALAQGKSLLPAGLSAVSGTFGRGEPVTLRALDGRHLGQGLTRYTHDEATAIAGRHSSEIEEVLGYPGRAVVIHHDDMAL
ncbi:glutamate 5-kinase [Tropicibacter naphthalenivorans]|uniref:Glutamate 5-kinase n=1 Tax=Tropicibacter naphthalenivorans TaxID=441103 RepID=A0A0P1G7T5_9RHOB|nr:glutamate 5-kinase [Tropicibacter naphthalenivorans]CUH77679.1 Glutamate 5-kinase [Tropicibacter naphthalenivorans]SMC54302.1 glutamate 5-kinase [Tropicibacter naphthalenivorans]